MKKTIIVLGWLVGSSLALIVSTSTLHFLRQTQSVPFLHHAPTSQKQQVLSYHHISKEAKGINGNIQSDDARPILIAEFLEEYNSPLKPYDYWGEFLTQLADSYGLDYRLLPSIAMQESNVCKKIPAGSYNCLGLGVHSRGTWEFPSFESNFEAAAKVLRENYIDEGLITPDEIQDKYTPSSNGSWEFAVNQFMHKLETADF